VLLTNFEEQNCFIDISGTIDLKLAALAKHMSQIPDTDQTNKMLKRRAEETGAACGFAFAEGFVRIDVHP
jgi:LmbE family N-acetylglucosaminyl deacetylase